MLPDGLHWDLFALLRCMGFSGKGMVGMVWSGLTCIAVTVEQELKWPSNVCAQVLTVRQATDWTAHVADTAAETGLSGTNGLFEVHAWLV